MGNITIRTADLNDVDTLVRFRFLYMTDVEGELLKKERMGQINDFVRELPKKERELMLRRYFYLQSSKQIAFALGMTVNAVDTKLSRLRMKARDALLSPDT